MFISRKRLFSLVRPVLVNVEAGVEVTKEAEEEVMGEGEVAEVTITVVERVVALALNFATQGLKQRPHLHFEAKQCLP